jgi:hypothetical protein
MPRNPIDYSNTMVYKICCNDITIKDCYVGVTTNLVHRTDNHKRNCYNTRSKHYNYFVHQFIRSHGGFSNWSLVLVNKYNCQNYFEARQKERYHIEELQATLNKQLPRDFDINDTANLKENMQKYCQKQYQLNKKNLQTRRGKQHQCLCGSVYCHGNRSRHYRTTKHIAFIKSYNNICQLVYHCKTDGKIDRDYLISW